METTLKHYKSQECHKQTNLEDNSHEDEGNTNYDEEGNDEGNTNNIEDSPPKDGGFPNQHEGNTNDSEENGPGNTHIMDDEISIKNGSTEDP